MAHKQIVIYDEICNWDCNFSFTQDEVEEWRHEDFYLFLYGQKITQGFINTKCTVDWINTAYYRTGKAKAFRPRKEAKSKLKANAFPFKVKTPKETRATRDKKHKLIYDGIMYEIVAPISKKRKFIPKIGMNLTIDAKDQYYYYTIRQSKYIFVYERAKLHRPIDITHLLFGRGEWPQNLQHMTLCFDSEKIIAENIREYHFINFILKKRRQSFATYTDWLEFRLLIETSPGSIY